MHPFPIIRSLAFAAAGVSVLLPACGEGPERTIRAGSDSPPPQLFRRADDAELQSRVAAALTADGHLKAEAITVSVKRGEVTLAGAVPADQIARADAVARQITGVAVVINALRSTSPAS